MTILDILENPQFRLINSPQNTTLNVSGVFACDLLSHVMGFAKEEQLLITVLNNINVLGVASLLDLHGVIFSHNIPVSKNIIDKANELSIPLLSTSLTTAEAVVLLHQIEASN